MPKGERIFNYLMRFALALMAVVVTIEATTRPETRTRDRLILLVILGPILLLCYLMTTEKFRNWCEKAF